MYPVHRKIALLAAMASLAGATACGGSDAPPAGQPGKPQATLGAVEWTECQERQLSLACATVDVPLDWSDPDSERISFFVRRLDAATDAPLGQVWLFVGGPGSSGRGLLDAAPHFAGLGYDVYVPDYRGVGRSTPLACAGETGRQTSLDCIDELWDRFGEGLRFFSTTDAAMDVGKTIEAFRKPGEKVFVYGMSYGTFLGNRYLTLFPDQADGAILDGICPATGCNIHQDLNLNLVAKQVFDTCGRDPDCREKLSADPWAKLTDLQKRLSSGHCRDFAGFYGAQALSTILAWSVDNRHLVPLALASAYRLDRCSPEDVEAVKTLLTSLAPGVFDPAENAPYSDFLYQAILLSEFWEPALTPEDLIAEVRDLVVAPGYGYSLAAMRDDWLMPLYETPAELYRWADVSMPVLLLNGTLDAQTTVWDLETAGLADAFSKPGQSYVEVPFGAHGILYEGSARGGQTTCGFHMVADFLDDPTRPVDTSCLAGLEQIDLEGAGLPSRNMFGTSSLWENLGVRALTAAPDPDAVAAFERAKERAAALRRGW